MTRLRSSASALPLSSFGGRAAVRRTNRAPADESSFGAAGLRLRSSASALPLSSFGGRAAVRRTNRAPADESSFGAAGLRLCSSGWLRTAIGTAAAVAIGGSSRVFACPVCFGAEETAMIDGTKLGILALLAVTLVVQGGFVGFFLYLRKRAKHVAEVELDTEWSELQRGASRAS